MPGRLAALALLAGLAQAAAAQDTAQWPPPQDAAARMRALQLVIIDRQSTLAQREAARNELMGMLKSPAGRERGALPGEKAPRAAIIPYPSVVQPVNIAPASPPQAGVARLEVVSPRSPIVNPATGSVIVPMERFAIDPRTGNVLHEAGPGFIDPRTGQYTPR
jgi:hypothetical protein